jgi:hypothetical protein
MRTRIGQLKVGAGINIIAALTLSIAFPFLTESANAKVGIGKGVRADYIPEVDTFIVDGSSKDTLAIVVWKIPTIGLLGSCKDASRSSPTKCRYEFPEGKIIQWRLCIKYLNSPKRDLCGPTVREKT